MVSEKQKKIKLLYLISALLIITIIGLGFSLFGSQSFSIISASSVNMGENGIPQWVIYLDGTLQDSKYIFSVPSQKLPVYDSKKANGKVVPQDDVQIQVKRKGTTCQYNLEFGRSGYYDTFDWLSFVQNRDYYGIGTTTTTHNYISIIDNYGNNDTIDALNIGNSTTKFSHNDGDILITATGGLVSNYQCPQLDNYIVEHNTETNTIKFKQQDLNGNEVDRTNYVIQGVISSCHIDNNDVSKPIMICDVNKGTVVNNPTLKIVADAKYLDFTFIPTTVGVPEIVSINKPKIVNEASINALSVKVKNVGKEDGTFKLYAESKAFAFLPEYQTISLKSGEEQEHSFTFTSPKINQDYDFTSTFRLCSISDVSRGECVTKDTKISVKDVGIIDKLVGPNNTCGNGVCDSNENYATCSADCNSPLVCDGLNMYKSDNKCLCTTGYDMKEDKFGKTYCAKTQSNTIIMIAIASLILAILVIMIIVAKRRRK